MPLASTTWDVVSGLLPLVLLFGFWFVLMRRLRTNNPQEMLAAKLDEIRDELVRIRRALEQRDVWPALSSVSWRRAGGLAATIPSRSARGRRRSGSTAR